MIAGCTGDVYRRSRLLTLRATLALALGSIGVAQLEAVIEAVLDSTGATPVTCPDLVVEAELSGTTCAVVADERSLVADVDRGLSEVMDDDWLLLELWGTRLILHSPTDAILAILIIIADSELPEFTGLVFAPLTPY